MNDDIKKDLFEEKYNDYINSYVDNLIKDNNSIINEYPILEIEYDIDGKKKDIYSLASERDIKKMQVSSNKNELDYKFSQNEITSSEYEEKINDINKKMKNIDLVYDDLIFNIINNNSLEELSKSILSYNLNNIDLDRLARAISSTIDNKIEAFRENNKLFMIDKITYWNYKYNKLSKQVSKSREVETFILNLIEK